MCAKITILRGLPGTGKSTLAKEIIEKTGNTVRINRDLLRKMLHFEKWSGKNESCTINAAKTVARNCLKHNINVIIDDTNLNEKTVQSWKTIASETDSKFEIKDLTKDINLTELFRRDSERENQVGRHVIVSMAIQHKLIGPKEFGKNRKWIICDIDGTLADITHRLEYVKKIPKNWKSFFENLDKDLVRKEIVEMVLNYQKQGFSIIFVSGRPETYRKKTKEWIENVAFKDVRFHEGEEYATILMRKATDKRPDDITKKEILYTYFNKEDIELIIDDRPRVLRMWAEEGLNVLDVGPGIEF